MIKDICKEKEKHEISEGGSLMYFHSRSENLVEFVCCGLHFCGLSNSNLDSFVFDD